MTPEAISFAASSTAANCAVMAHVGLAGSIAAPYGKRRGIRATMPQDTRWRASPEGVRHCVRADLFTAATSAPGLGLPLPHLHRDWVYRCHICTGTGFTAATSAPGLGLPLPHLHRDWVYRCHICTGTTAGARACFALGLGPTGRLPHATYSDAHACRMTTYDRILVSSRRTRAEGRRGSVRRVLDGPASNSVQQGSAATGAIRPDGSARASGSSTRWSMRESCKQTNKQTNKQTSKQPNCTPGWRTEGG
jgi:hypothetical protein